MMDLPRSGGGLEWWVLLRRAGVGGVPPDTEGRSRGRTLSVGNHPTGRGRRDEAGGPSGQASAGVLARRSARRVSSRLTPPSARAGAQLIAALRLTAARAASQG